MGIRTLFTAHPASIGETYLEHLAHAAGFAARLLVAGIACLIHALLPFVFAQTASRAIVQLHERMVTARRTDRATARPRPQSAGSQSSLTP